MKIKFMPASEEAFNFTAPPKPAKLYIPEWYKSIKPLKENELKFNESTQISNLNVKNCVPYLDALSSGYIQELWTDILIEKNNEEIVFRYATSPAPLSAREKISVKIDQNFYPFEFVWQRHWGVSLPKGYSMLVTQPLGRVDLPFQTMSAIVDADTFKFSGVGNIPFYIKKDFLGIIPAGTPMYQIIPFKRDNWESSIENYNGLETEKSERNIKRHFLNSYKKQFWQKKTYN
jgi:hypothetical protein